MNDLLTALLDLDRLALTGDDVALGFERPLPGWGWALVVLGSAAFAVWSYSRLIGPRYLRGILAAARTMLLVLLVLLVSGPKLVQQTESVERDWILVLLDRSISMTIPDAPTGTGERTTREAQIEQLLEQTSEQWRELAEEREVVWLGFDRESYDLESIDSAIETVRNNEPDGRRTRLGAAIEGALERAAARPLSAVVIVSDGRTTDPPSRASIRRLRADRVPVHTVALGSDEPVGDFAVARVDAPGTVYADDPTPITVRIDRAGVPPGTDATVQLIDRATGRVLDEKTIRSGDDEDQGERKAITLTSIADVAGERTWSVRIDAGADDLISTNNEREFDISVVDEPMRVLYVDGYPRWEQRYLRNLLIREESVVATTLLLAPDRRYIQEGEVEVDAIPDSPERWADYDAVILGDVQPEVFTVEQLAMLRDHVADRGAGLIWIAGPGATPGLWWDTPLASLIPMRPSPESQRALPEPAVAFPTNAARRLGVLRLTNDPEAPWPDALSSPDTGWSILRYVQMIEPARLKPAAEVLAEAEELYSYERLPMVVTMRYGSGRSTYVATDETWRWRYGRGEALFERFWIQHLRMSARESLARAGRSALFTLSHERAPVGEPVQVSLELIDQSLIDLQLASVEVELTRRPTPGAPAPDSERTQRLTLQPEGASRAVYTGTWLPEAPGVWDAEPTDAALADAALSREVEVTLVDDELRRPETDHELLADLSAQTGGRMFEVSDVRDLFEDPMNLPKRRVVLLNERSESLWDTPLALILVIGLLTAEWVVRRVIRLI